MSGVTSSCSDVLGRTLVPHRPGTALPIETEDLSALRWEKQHTLRVAHRTLGLFNFTNRGEKGGAPGLIVKIWLPSCLPTFESPHLIIPIGCQQARLQTIGCQVATSRVQRPPGIDCRFGMVDRNTSIGCAEPSFSPVSRSVTRVSHIWARTTSHKIAAECVRRPGDVALPFLGRYTDWIERITVAGLEPGTVGILRCDQCIGQRVGILPHPLCTEDNQRQRLVVGVRQTCGVALPRLEQAIGPLLGGEPGRCGRSSLRLSRHSGRCWRHITRCNIECAEVVNRQAAGAASIILRIFDNRDEQGADTPRIKRCVCGPGLQKGKGRNQLIPPAMMRRVMIDTCKDALTASYRVDQADLDGVAAGCRSAPFKAQVVIGREIERGIEVAANLRPVAVNAAQVVVQLKRSVVVASNRCNFGCDRRTRDDRRAGRNGFKIQEGPARAQAQIGPRVWRIVLNEEPVANLGLLPSLPRY